MLIAEDADASPGHPRSDTGKFNNSRILPSSAIAINASPSTVLSRAVCKKDQYDISLLIMVCHEAILCLATPR
jgi:hypothetical protein